MDNMGNKKLALLYILKILQEYTNPDHPMTQGEIAERLENAYGIVLERKAISRNLSLLQEAGYEIQPTTKGVYLNEWEFDDTELRMIIDGVLSSRYMSEKEAKSIADRLSRLSNKYFRSCLRHISVLSEHEKSENNAVFYNVGIVDEALENGRQVSFNYYRIDQNLKLTFDQRLTVSPVQMVVKNQFYYLIAAEERTVYDRAAHTHILRPFLKIFRLDLIRNPIIEEQRRIDLSTVWGLEKGFDLHAFLKEHPYMHTAGLKPQRASFLCYERDLELVVENLGTDLTLRKIKPYGHPDGLDPSVGLARVTLTIDPENLIEFAARYPQKIFITEPESARDRLRDLYTGALQIGELIQKYDNT